MVVDEWNLKLRLTVSRRSVKVAKAAPGRNAIRLSDADFTRLLLGSPERRRSIGRGRVQTVRTATALQTAAVALPAITALASAAG